MADAGDPLARVFVGSAGKSRGRARRVAQQLKRQARDRPEPVEIEADSWEYTFKSGDITYARLLECVRHYNFGVFIFTADDDAVVDGKDTKITRDNVIFELGLWAGAHGKDYAHVLRSDDEKMRLLTDLEGYVTERFEHESDQSLDEASGNVLKKIIEVAEKDRQDASSHISVSQQMSQADVVLRQQLDARLRSGTLDGGSPENLKQGMLVISAIYGLGHVLSSDDELIRVRFFEAGTKVLLHGEVALPAL